MRGGVGANREDENGSGSGSYARMPEGSFERFFEDCGGMS